MPGLSLANLLENTVYAKALDALARSLWIIFAGWSLLVPAIGIMIVQMVADKNKWDFPGEELLKMSWPWLAIAAALLNLYGKYNCFELRQPLEFGQPLPGAKQLSISFYADITATLIRFVAKGAWKSKIGWLATPFYLIGQIMFLLFLRKMADVVERHWIKRLIDCVLASLLLTILSGGGALALLLGQVRNPFLLLGSGLATVIFTLLTTAGYLLILVQLALALGSFAGFLRESAFDELSDDEADEAAVQ